MARHTLSLSFDNPDHWQEVHKRNRIAVKIEEMRREALLVAQGKELVCYLSGPPGCGKGHAVKAALKATGRKFIEKVPRDYKDLMRTFYEAGKDKAIVLDEADNIFRSERDLNMLKIATDRAGSRWYGERWQLMEWDEEREKEVPHRMLGVHLHAPLFVMTNQHPDGLDPKMKIHTDALWSRNPPIVIEDDREAMLEWTIYLALSGDLILHDYRGRRIAMDTRVAALTWFVAHRARLDSLAPRALKQIAQWFSERGHEAGAAKATSYYAADRAGAHIDDNEQPDWRTLRLALERQPLQPAMKRGARQSSASS